MSALTPHAPKPTTSSVPRSAQGTAPARSPGSGVARPQNAREITFVLERGGKPPDFPPALNAEQDEELVDAEIVASRAVRDAMGTPIYKVSGRVLYRRLTDVAPELKFPAALSFNATVMPGAELPSLQGGVGQAG